MTQAARNANPSDGQPSGDSRGRRRVLVGTVTSDRMEKTITVEISRLVRHPLYEKFVRRRTRVHAHDENNEARIGDTVEVVESRPLSKLKRFRLLRVAARAVQD
ncbi:MAG: 30S ribosomal protein S17 [Planctomycetes bacterium]|nr:30S ribosomal protein S17 [Planctomycetota bacterium]